MATHFSILTWTWTWTEEPGRLQSIGTKSWTEAAAAATGHCLWYTLRSSLILTQFKKLGFFFYYLQGEVWELEYFLPYNRQGCHSQQWLQPSNVSPEGTQGGEYLPFSSLQTTANPYGEPWGKEAQDVKNTGNWPQIVEVHIKWISVSPDSCIFPYKEKS